MCCYNNEHMPACVRFLFLCFIIGINSSCDKSSTLTTELVPTSKVIVEFQTFDVWFKRRADGC